MRAAAAVARVACQTWRVLQWLSFVPFEASATPQSVADQFDWSTLVHRTAAHNFGQWKRYSSDVNFGASSDVDSGAGAEDSGLTEVPADPNLGCDDRPLTYRRTDDEPDADSSERHRSLCLDSGAHSIVQSYVCTTVPTKTHPKPKTDAKRGELSIKEACSPEYLRLPLFLKGLDRELGEMDRRRFMADEEAGAVSELESVCDYSERRWNSQSSAGGQGPQMQTFC